MLDVAVTAWVLALTVTTALFLGVVAVQGVVRAVRRRRSAASAGAPSLVRTPVRAA